mmetsp:Transcript_2997/g.5002  ORF Transcript_2997/g.5002 Transcript_2997/m.5002 type:complete len:225 (+) Transcript_2997:1808-2482(+)
MQQYRRDQEVAANAETQMVSMRLRFVSRDRAQTQRSVDAEICRCHETKGRHEIAARHQVDQSLLGIQQTCAFQLCQQQVLPIWRRTRTKTDGRSANQLRATVASTAHSVESTTSPFWSRSIIKHEDGCKYTPRGTRRRRRRRRRERAGNRSASRESHRKSSRRNDDKLGCFHATHCKLGWIPAAKSGRHQLERHEIDARQQQQQQQQHGYPGPNQLDEATRRQQ